MKKLWKKALKKVFGLREGKTAYTLGQWLHNDISQWTWFHSPRTNTIYQKLGDKWKSWQRETHRGREGTTSRYKYHSECIAIPTNLQRATVQYWTRNRITLEGSAPAREDTTITFSHSVSTNALPINIVHDHLNIQLFKQSLNDHTAMAVCDGSYFPESKVGAAAFVIEEPIQHTQLHGTSKVYGQAELQNPC